MVPPRLPSVAVVVPSHRGGTELARCLAAIRSQAPDELVVAVDGGGQDAVAQATAAGARVVVLSAVRGPAAARNAGVRAAASDVVLFVDADVELGAGAVERVRAAFAADPSLDALFGSYDDAPDGPGLVSQYRNLLHHWVHQTASAEATTFWAGCGAVRREVFLRAGGFDERYAEPSIEDVELGWRLARDGRRLRLDKGLLARHLKRWTLASMIHTDVYRRALPWTALIARGYPLGDDLSLRRTSRASAALLALASAAAGLGCLQPAWLGVAAAALAGVLALNAPLYGFFLRKRGSLFTVGAIGLHWLYFAYASLAFAAGSLSPAPAPSTVADAPVR